MNGTSLLYLSKKDVSRVLGVSLPTVTRLMRTGELPHLKIGGRVRFRAEDIQPTREPVQPGEEPVSYEYLDKKQVCSVLKISSATLNRMLKRGKIKYRKFGRSVRFRVEDIGHEPAVNEQVLGMGGSGSFRGGLPNR
jgi:excisionase family DNA binding protein